MKPEDVKGEGVKPEGDKGEGVKAEGVKPEDSRKRTRAQPSTVGGPASLRAVPRGRSINRSLSLNLSLSLGSPCGSTQPSAANRPPSLRAALLVGGVPSPRSSGPMHGHACELNDATRRVRAPVSPNRSLSLNLSLSLVSYQLSGLRFLRAVCACRRPKGARRQAPSAVAAGCFAKLRDAICALPALRQVCSILRPEGTRVCRPPAIATRRHLRAPRAPSGLSECVPS